MEGKAWRIESPGASITENIEQATLALRLGIAVNGMRAVQKFSTISATLRGLSLPLLKFSGGSIDILRDVLH